MPGKQTILKKTLLEVLVEDGMLSAERLAELQKTTSDENKLIEQIASKGLVPEEDLAKAKSKVLGVPYIDLFGKTASPSVLNLISRELAENYHIVAFEKVNSEVSVAMVDPGDFKAIEAIEFIARENNFKIKFFLISLSGFRYVAKQYATLGAEVEQALEGTE